jgi:hypothetical protein
MQIRTLSHELDILKTNSDSEIQTLRTISGQYQRSNAEAEEKISNLERSLKIQSEIYSKNMKQLQDEKQEEVEKLISAHTADILTAKASIDDLQQRISELSAERPRVITSRVYDLSRFPCRYRCLYAISNIIYV